MKNPNTFWNWFIENRHKFLQQQKPINSSNQPLKTHPLTDKETLFHNLQIHLNNYCNNLKFLLQGSSNGKLKLTITTNGNKANIIKAAYLVSKAPNLPNWKFTASLKPMHDFDTIIDGTDPTYQFQHFKIKISDLYFLATNYCEESKKFDITVYVMEFWKHPNQLLNQAVTIMLEDLLGEHLAYLKINRLTIEQHPKNTNLIPVYDMKLYFETFNVN
ncbi:hypothetical protein [Bizionia sp.]|uniref:hypothetical protein n=1 Tax=Bizionia sp. TaxID=1954480 RepID=UPI003A957069